MTVLAFLQGIFPSALMSMVFSLVVVSLISNCYGVDLERQSYEVQWHWLTYHDSDPVYMRGTLSALRSFPDQADLPVAPELPPSPAGIMALAVNLLDEPLDSVEICVKKRLWTTDNAARVINFHGAHSAGINLPATLDPSCSYFVDNQGDRHSFMVKDSTYWPGKLDLVIFELTPVQPVDKGSLPANNNPLNALVASSGASGGFFPGDSKWHFYPGAMPPSLGFVDIFPLSLNPFARLFSYNSDERIESDELLVIHFINSDGTDARITVTQKEFTRLTDEMPVTHPDFWKLLAGSEINVRVGETIDLASVCRLSGHLSIEVAQLADSLLSDAVQCPPPDEPEQSKEQAREGSNNPSKESQAGPGEEPSGSSSAEGQASGDGSGDRDQDKPEGSERSIVCDSEQGLIDMLVEAAEDGNMKTVRTLLMMEGKKRLWKFHSRNGDTALHAACRARQEAVIEHIRQQCRQIEYSLLLHLPNRENQTPQQLLDNSEKLTLQQLLLLDNSEEPALQPFFAPPPLAKEMEQAKAFLPEDQQMNEYFQRYNLDLKQHNNPRIQQVSEGRQACIVHPGFHHAEVQLPCCDTFICQPAVIALARKMISEFMKGGDDSIYCPNCQKQLDLLKQLEGLKSSTEENISLESMKPVDPMLRIFQKKKYYSYSQKSVTTENISPETTPGVTVKKAPPKQYLSPALALLEETKQFTAGLLSILYEHKEVKSMFERKVLLLEMTECEICFQALGCIQLSREQECTHRFCRECLREYLQHSATDFNALSSGLLSCPGTDCKVQIPDYVVQAITGKDVLKKLHRSLLQLAARKNKNLFICLNPSCENVIDIGEACHSKVICNSCGRSSCSACLVTPFHEGWSCAVYQKALTSDGAQEMFEAFKKEHAPDIRQCPVCKGDIYRDMGCNLMHCSNCQEKFCWICMKVITREEYKHFRGEKCDLWGAPVQPATELVTTEDEVSASEKQPRCQRCRGENVVQQPCGHYICEECLRQLVVEEKLLDLDFGIQCYLCRNLKQDAKEPEEKPLPPEGATGITATSGASASALK